MADEGEVRDDPEPAGPVADRASGAEAAVRQKIHSVDLSRFAELPRSSTVSTAGPHGPAVLLAFQDHFRER